MRFNKLRLTGLTTLELPAVGLAPSDPYILKGADGLGPPEVDIYMNDGVYQDRGPQDREVVIKVGLNPTYSSDIQVSDLRAYLYGMLTPGVDDIVTLYIMNDATVVAQTVGYVKRIEIAPFSKEPEVLITLSCVSKYLQAPADTIVPNVNLSKPTGSFNNDGSAPTGFYLEITLTAAASVWTIYNANATKKISLTYAFNSGDKIVIDTRRGSRSISRVRSGVSLNLLYTLSTDSDWLQLHGGVNSLVMPSSSFNWTKLQYRPQYWGV